MWSARSCALSPASPPLSPTAPFPAASSTVASEYSLSTACLATL